MATKIKRCLYVGLGGTGMNALLHTKKTFIDTYGEVPPMIGFLGLDTDGGAYKKTLFSVRGEEIKLDPNEQMPIQCADPRPIYTVHKDELSWLPEKNLGALDGMTLGAGQVRSNGRFAFTVNYVDVCHKVKTMIDKITNARIVDNDQYELLSTETEIHMVFSVCGGTGCGTFINMAYLLRNVAPKCKLTGYAVLPNIFKAVSKGGMAKVAPNAYGAIVDLDYLMHMTVGSTPFKLQYINDSIDVNLRPFDAVVFVDNKNTNNDTYTQVDELAEMISLALVTSAGELSSASASVSDNISKNINEGTMDIENKKAWAAGMGICEIIYRNSDLCQIYATKAAQILIDRLFNSSTDINTLVNAWIDSADVNIRENNNCDHVIDFIADKNPKYELTINEDANPMPEVEQYLQMNRIKDDATLAKVSELTTRVRGELRKLLVEQINKEGGVSDCTNLINGIEAQVNEFLADMVSEKEAQVDLQPKYRTTLETAVTDLKTYDGKFFKTKAKLEERENDVVDAARALCICQREVARRDAAIQVFNKIKAMLIEAHGRIKVISDTLRSVRSTLTTNLARLQNGIGKSSQIFQIDLSEKEATTMSVNTEEILVSGFVQSLSEEKNIYGFNDYNAEEVYAFIMDYTKQLHSARKIADTTIDDIIDKLDDEEYDRIIQLAISKSMPLFRYNYHGHMPKEQPHDSYYIGVPDKTKSRLKKDDSFKHLISGTADCDFATIGVTDKVIIYRQIGVVPAYAIVGIDEFRREYEDCNVACYIDQNLLTRMEREEFSIQPKRATDDDLLDLWVKGFIFGLVKKENGEYMFQSDEHGDVLDDNWVSLGKYRDEAFEQFRRFKTSIRREFTNKLEDIASSRGADAMNAILADARANYRDKFSQLNMTIEKLKEHGNEKIAQLVRDELNHVKEL